MGQYIYFKRPLMTTSPAEHLMTESYSKLLAFKGGSFMVIYISSRAETIEKNGIRNTVSVDRTTVALVAKDTSAADNRTQRDERDPEREETYARGYVTTNRDCG